MAEHSYYVTLYAFQIADMINWKGDHRNLATYAMAHDADELELGDIPATIKRELKSAPLETAELSQRVFQSKFPDGVDWFVYYHTDVKHIVKCADCMDAVMFLCEEIQVGNTTLGSPNAYMGMSNINFINQEWGKPNHSILYRNLHRLRVTVDNLPFNGHNDPYPQGNRLWQDTFLPAIWSAIRGVSKRVF